MINYAIGTNSPYTAFLSYIVELVSVSVDGADINLSIWGSATVF
jgi:hypothetical protein